MAFDTTFTLTTFLSLKVFSDSFPGIYPYLAFPDILPLISKYLIIPRSKPITDSPLFLPLMNFAQHVILSCDETFWSITEDRSAYYDVIRNHGICV